MASTANQKKIVTTANKVRTITDTQYMVQLHFILRKTAAAQGTAAALKTVQLPATAQQTVADIPATVVITTATLHTVSRHVNTNPAYLPFLQKIHNAKRLYHRKAADTLKLRKHSPEQLYRHIQIIPLKHSIISILNKRQQHLRQLLPSALAVTLAPTRYLYHDLSLFYTYHHTPSFPQCFLAFWLPILPPFLPTT